ncbi:MAG: hypothetical protein AAFR67_14715, partial [Chloroflexota bacterium]
MAKLYKYVGLSKIRDDLPKKSSRQKVLSAENVREWLNTYARKPDYENVHIVTFIVSLDGFLWINERRSEHVLCANGQPPLSAGEMSFAMDDDDIIVVGVTNQSTGYCPEPSSWIAVETALSKTDIVHPVGFDPAYDFRLCDTCETINIVKDS